MKELIIDQDVLDFILSKASQAGESPAQILRRQLPLPPPTQTIQVDDDTYNFLLSKTASVGESASDILRRELSLSAPSPHGNAATVVFHIPAGTGTQPWNTSENAVRATVGDTLRLVNDDSVPHRLHTTGIPFPHPTADVLPGKTADFLLQAPFDPGANQPLYDHDVGQVATFWIIVRSPG